ncbi:hypothetical protein P879_02436 [Paragonimus westermani]|uniref:RING-type domain-containing protein n=1 Tax=Paragonimus westermani TaxID=34504 RepID=A0A8T0DWU1_9TREM|nr:hypothetical protein P879_02436 [Paragonimus westermani]
MHRVTNIPIVMINPMLTCKLCTGYLIDATTIVECLHSFCRSCILSHLKQHTTCPVCDTLLHKTRPHYAIRPDRALQAIVYKLIPNLFEREMSCRREFYEEHPHPEVRSLSPEKKGEITLNAYVLQEEEHISIELEYWQPTGKQQLSSDSSHTETSSTVLNHQSTYLLCPPDVTVAHLEKLIRLKFGLEPNDHKVAMFFTTDDLFNSDYTLSDLACLYSWRRLQPMKLYFTIVEHSSLSDSTVRPAGHSVNHSSSKPSSSRSFLPPFSVPPNHQCESKKLGHSTSLNPGYNPCSNERGPTSLSVSHTNCVKRTSNLPSLSDEQAHSVHPVHLSAHGNNPSSTFLCPSFSSTHPLPSMTLTTNVPILNSSSSICSPQA